MAGQAGQLRSGNEPVAYGLHSVRKFLVLPPTCLFQCSAVTFVAPCRGDIHAMGQRVGMVKLCRLVEISARHSHQTK